MSLGRKNNKHLEKQKENKTQSIQKGETNIWK